MSMGDALQGVLMLLVLIAVGFFAAKRGLLTESLENALSRLTIKIAIPALLFCNTLSFVSLDFIRSLGWLLLIPPASLLVGYGLGYLAAKLFRVPAKDLGVFLVMFALSNCAFIGIPVTKAIFGDAGMPYVVTFFPANTAVFWTLGNLGIARDGGKKPDSFTNTVKQIFSPPLLGFLFGLVAVILGFRLPGTAVGMDHAIVIPKFLAEALTYLGGLTVPVSLLTTGAVLSRMGKDAVHVGRTGLLALLGRMIIMPAITLGMCLSFGAPAILTNVYTMISCMPVMSQCVIMSSLHGANNRLSAQMLTLSTLLSMVWIPLWVLLLQIVVG